jgi:hypothetical protein
MVLTGPKAIKRAEEHGLVDAHGMREIWEDLDHCWKEFDAMRRTNSDALDIEQYVGVWQVSVTYLVRIELRAHENLDLHF